MHFKLILFLWLITSIAQAAIQGKTVEYSAGETPLKGFLAYDDSIQGQRPGVLVVHEWWGHNEYARNRAKMLAELGYTAFAVDMYGQGKNTEHPKEAGQFAQQLRDNMTLAQSRFEAALAVLKQHETVNPEQIAAIGYCFGGGIVLEMARRGLDLDAVASFHGSLETDNPAQAGTVKAKILVLHGAEDKLVKQEAVSAFKKEMHQAQVDFKFISYEGVQHSFTNPQADKFAQKYDLPVGYDAQADKKSWQQLKTFLQQVFKE